MFFGINLKKAKTNSPKLLILAGLLGILVALGIILFTFYPVLKAEFFYRFYRSQTVTVANISEKINSDDSLVLTPIDQDFSLIIPKLAANAKVIPNVDPQNAREYQQKLTQGVAHAKGSALPGQSGNVFIFAHSAGNFYEANRYNAIFYLLSKLEANDPIYLFFQNQKYDYQVVSRKIVNPQEVSYLEKQSDSHTLTLMTCWPPGTTLKRLIISATETVH